MAYEWKIIDGDLPFLSEFPQMYNVNEPLASFFFIVDGDLPYRDSYPQMYTVTEAPESFRQIEDGDLPFRRQFADVIMYEYEPFTGIENMRKGDTKVRGVRLEDTEIKLVCLGDFKVYKKPEDTM